MHELTLHILDLIENATRAGAGVVRITLCEDREENRLEIDVEDDGPGLPVSPEVALDPFFTTKSNKRTGLGLSLFQAAAEEAEGGLALERSDLGGVRVAVWMTLNHIDRRPLGNLPCTLSLMACTAPELRIVFRAGTPGKLTERASGLEPGETPVEAARRFGEAVRQTLSGLEIAREI